MKFKELKEKYDIEQAFTQSKIFLRDKETHEIVAYIEGVDLHQMSQKELEDGDIPIYETR